MPSSPFGRPAPTPAQRLRPWLMPALALVVAIALFAPGGFDAGDVRDALAAGDADGALHALATAPQQDLPAAIRNLHWWTRGRRAEALAELSTRPEPELLEDPRLPTLVAPLGVHLQPPAAARLREPAAAPLRLELQNVTLNLPVATLAVAPGTQELPFGETLIPGTRYGLWLREGADGSGPVVAVADFTLASPSEAAQIGAVLAAARELGPAGHPGADLLAANAALECGLGQQALDLLRGVQAAPGAAEGLRRAARELEAVALDELGLDVTARARLAAP